MMAKKDQMTPKQERFVQEYVADPNGAKDARLAGYSERRAKETASRLVTKGNVAEAIAKSRHEIAKEAGFTAERMFKEMYSICFSNIRDVLDVDEDGCLVFRKLDEIPDSVWPSVKEITTFSLPDGSGTAYKIQLWDKMRGLALAGKWLLEETDPTKPDGKQQINTTILLNNATVDNPQRAKVIVNGKLMEESANANDQT